MLISNPALLRAALIKSNRTRVQFIGSVYSSSDLTTYTFSSQSLGIVDATRRIVVACGRAAAGDGTISSLTVAGVAATSLIAINNNSSNNASLHIAHVPAGTTGDIVVTAASGCTRMAIGVWAVYNLASETPKATASSTADPAALNVNTDNPGVVIAYVFGSQSTTVTWTGVTERFDETGEFNVSSGADHTVIGVEGPRTVTGDYASGGAGDSGVCVSLR